MSVFLVFSTILFWFACFLCQSFLIHYLAMSCPSKSAPHILRCFFIPVSSFMPSPFTLHILLTQLLYAICCFSFCLFVSACVPNPYAQAGTMHASNTFPFSSFFNILSNIIPPTVPIRTLMLACNVLCPPPPLLPPFSHIVLPRYTYLIFFPSTNT